MNRHLQRRGSAGSHVAPPAVRRYWVLPAGLVVSLLLLYLAVEAAGVPGLTDPSSLLTEPGLRAAVAGVALLVGDVVLPVPSSVVMIAHGALFGLAVGAALSLVGRVGCALAGFALGRRGGALVARITTREEQLRADRLLRRWGPVAIVLTRPVPLLSETTMILAGTSTMRWRAAIGAALVGSLPEAALYAFAGAIAATFQSTALMFAFLLLVSAVVWLARRRANNPLEGEAALEHAARA